MTGKGGGLRLYRDLGAPIELNVYSPCFLVGRDDVEPEIPSRKDDWDEEFYLRTGIRVLRTIDSAIETLLDKVKDA